MPATVAVPLAAVPLFLVILAAWADAVVPHWTRACLVDRLGFGNGTRPPSLIPVVGDTHVVLACHVVAALLLGAARLARRVSIPDICRLYLWGSASFLMCNVLKEALADNDCNKHSNSVSGHFNYFLYLLLAARFLTEPGMGMHSRTAMSKLVDGLRAALLVPVILTLYTTYAGGYHSLRQCVYGAAFGLFNFSIFSAAVRDRRMGDFHGLSYCLAAVGSSLYAARVQPAPLDYAIMIGGNAIAFLN